MQPAPLTPPSATPAPPADATLPYATPATARRPGRGWLATAILFGGLSLVFLAGCFMIGVMSVVSPSAVGTSQSAEPLSPAQILFVTALYLIVALCLAGAGILITVGTRALLRLMD